MSIAYWQTATRVVGTGSASQSTGQTKDAPEPALGRARARDSVVLGRRHEDGDRGEVAVRVEHPAGVEGGLDDLGGPLEAYAAVAGVDDQQLASPLLRGVLAGLEELSHGSILIGDRDVTDVDPKDRDIAMVFQNYALYPHMTVADNMGFALKIAGVPADERRRRVEDAAKLLDLTEYLDRKPKALSGG